jgi:hydrogenase maturation protease
MAAPRIRALCLGNELLGDDSFGFRVAERLRQLPLENLDVVATSETGFHILDHIVDITCLLVIDTVTTGKADFGAVYSLTDRDFPTWRGDLPHCIGLFELLELARKLGLNVPDKVVILAVEASDSLVLGDKMHAGVQAAVPTVARMVQDLVSQSSR